MKFKLIGHITQIEIIAIGSSIRELSRLQKIYGYGRWRKVKGFADVQLSDNIVKKVELHWYEVHGIGKKEFKIKRFLSLNIEVVFNMKHKFVICVNNQGYEASLERGKVYQQIDEIDASHQNYIRVIDESGEDYLYPNEYFVEIKLPKKVKEVLIIIK